MGRQGIFWAIALLMGLFVGFLVGQVADAEDVLPAPDGAVLLEVSGAIRHGNAEDGSAQFDRALLRGLDWREITTYTSFTTGPQQFAGPTLVSLLEAVGAEGTQLEARAIDDYFVNIPVSHAAAHEVILALEHDGKPMRIRDKGPIWVIYPLSYEAHLDKPFDAQMIWQLNRLRVIE